MESALRPLRMLLNLKTFSESEAGGLYPSFKIIKGRRRKPDTGGGLKNPLTTGGFNQPKRFFKYFLGNHLHSA